MLDKGVRWWGIDCGSGDHPMNTTIRFMRKDLAKAFEKHAGMSLEEFFPPYQYKHKKSGRKVTNNIFPFHNYAMQEGLIHAENVGGDIDKALNTRCIIGAFPWKYEGLESCPCRIVAFYDVRRAGGAVLRQADAGDEAEEAGAVGAPRSRHRHPDESRGPSRPVAPGDDGRTVSEDAGFRQRDGRATHVVADRRVEMRSRVTGTAET